MRVLGWLFDLPGDGHVSAIIAATFALIANKVAWLVFSRPTPAANGQAIITAPADLVVQPFLVVVGILAVLRILDPSGMPKLMEIVAVPYVLTAPLFSDVSRTGRSVPLRSASSRVEWQRRPCGSVRPPLSSCRASCSPSPFYPAPPSRWRFALSPTGQARSQSRAWR